MKDIFCLRMDRTVDPYRKISLSNLQFKVHADPRKQVNLRIYPLNEEISEIRFWCEGKLIDVQRAKSSDLKGVHFSSFANRVFFWICYGRIICILFVKIICGHRRVEGEMERHVDMSHLRIMRREDLRWQRRRDVVTVGGGLLLIRGWVIVRRLVLLSARG
jgi:hypothetical protein